jgi:hypothetical protein
VGGEEKDRFDPDIESEKSESEESEIEEVEIQVNTNLVKR